MRSKSAWHTWLVTWLPWIIEMKNWFWFDS